MNEKLEIEIGHWLDKMDDKYCSLVEHYTIGDIRETSEHFYNLALEEVRKEVESNRNAVKCLSTGSSFNEGKLVMAHDILFFINNLTK